MSLKPKNINNLQLLCSRRFCSIKDIQAESILMMALTLSANYLNTNLEAKTKNLEIDSLSEDDKNKIKKYMQDLFDYLNSRVIPFTRMQEIMALSNKSRQAHMKARLVEPFGFYYNELANAFVDRLNYVTQKDEKQIYIPDMLAIFLILDYKNKTGYTFEKFDFIFKTNFDELAEIYFKASSIEKQKLGISYISHIHEQTTVRKMSSISLYMIDKLMKSNYSKATREINNKLKTQIKQAKRGKQQ